MELREELARCMSLMMDAMRRATDGLVSANWPYARRQLGRVGLWCDQACSVLKDMGVHSTEEETT